MQSELMQSELQHAIGTNKQLAAFLLVEDTLPDKNTTPFCNLNEVVQAMRASTLENSPVSFDSMGHLQSASNDVSSAFANFLRRLLDCHWQYRNFFRNFFEMIILSNETGSLRLVLQEIHNTVKQSTYYKDDNISHMQTRYDRRTRRIEEVLKNGKLSQAGGIGVST